MAPGCLFPADKPHARGSRDRRLELQHVDLDALTLQAAATFSCEHCVSVTLLFIATWAVVLSRYAETEHVQFGLVAHPHAAKENMLLTAVSLDQDMRMRRLLDESSWDTRLLSDRTDRALFNTAVVCDADIKVLRHECDILVVFSSSESPSPTGRLMFARHCLSYMQAENLASTIVQAMKSIMQFPDNPITEIDLISQHHLDQIYRWNRSIIEVEPERMVLDVISQRTASCPNAQAIDSWDGNLTYSELDDLSSRLALHLRTVFDVCEEMIVPTLFEKSLWAIVSFLAVVKAGGICAPMDPKHPIARLKSIVSNVQAKVILVSATYANHLQPVKGISTVVITGQEIQHLPTAAISPASIVHPRLGAYCIFTSGSTGKHKGCIHDHRSLATCVTLANRLSLREDSRVLQFASFSFIRSVLEIFCTLSAGATLCIPSDHDRMNALGDAINTLKVTFAMPTPSMVSTLNPASVPTLQTLFLGGETCEKDLLEAWLGKTHVVQGLGMTESAGSIICNDRISQSTDHRNVGFPFRGTCWLVDPSDHRKLSPIGAVSELVVEGPSLARGYLNMPAETKSAFLDIPPPWYPRRCDSDEAVKLYKTGDLVRYDLDGSIIYVGRKGTVVKIRGQRVDIAEVEQVISQTFSQKTKVAVDAISPRDRPNGSVLVAFICLSSPTAIGNSNSDMLHNLFMASDDNFLSLLKPIEEVLKENLPTYMIPNLFISIRSMPVTVNGKLNRLELKRQASNLHYEQLQALSSPRMGVVNVLPATVTERTVRRIVADLLKVDPERIGMDHNFIRLGGDSLLAMRMVGMLRTAGYVLTVADIMNNPSLSSMARLATPIVDSEFRREEFTPLYNFNPEQREDIRTTVAVQLQLDKARIEDIYLCTALQEGLIALSEKRSGMSMARYVYRVDETVDWALFKSAWEAVYQANVVLRTRFALAPSVGKSLQVVVQDETRWITATDLAAYKDQDNKKEVSVLGTSLVRTAVVTEKLDRYFVLTIHHALFDQWSLRTMLGQLQQLCNDHNKVLGKQLFSPFARYIASVTGMEQYWRSEFSELNAEIFPALPSPNYVPEADTEINHQINLPCHFNSEYTMSNVIRLAWGLVVSQYTNSDDVVFGVTTSGRAAMVPGIERMTGPTIATVPLRLRLQSNNSLENLLSAVQAQATRMIQFEQMGLQNIQKCSPEAHVACQFQSHLVVQPALAPVTGRLTILEQGSAVFGGFSNYTLVLVCTLSADGLGISIKATVDSNVLQREQARHFIELLDHFIIQIVTNPYRSINSLPFISSLDIAKLQKWNSILPASQDECVHKAIQRQFINRPNAPAVFAWDGELTYADLVSRSSVLAFKLTRRGIGPESFVPLLFEKSCWTIVAVLGVIKAGAAFVLLDSSFPESRLRQICDDVNCLLILSSSEKAEMCGTLGYENLLVNELTTSSDISNIAQYESLHVNNANALYVVFTSGSTGKPKGVVIEHRQYTSAVQNYKHAFRLDSSVRALQFSSYAFDASIIEMLTTLMVGGCICILSERQRWDSLASSIRQLKANHAFLTPSVSRLLMSQGLDNQFKTLVLVGEPMLASDIEYWAEKTHLINGYGPAECSIASCINPGVTMKSDPTNIGFGNHAGATCWVVDPHNSNKLLPIGAVGELLIEGPSVGRGYLNDPEKTETVFIQTNQLEWPNKFQSGVRHSRMYKTGDLVRYQVDGSLCYVGRKDSQVKLRGQRIELGEVESHLRRLFKGRDVIADVVVPISNRACLVAFVTSGELSRDTANTSSLSIFHRPTAEFRTIVAAVEISLRSSLPIFMIPTIYIPIARLPRTTSGKVDRRLLRETVRSLSSENLQSYITPQGTKFQRPVQTFTEMQLQSTWAHLLRISADQISAHDTFFHLGGDSIMAMKLVAAMAAQGRQVTVSDIFNHSKLCDLANIMDSKPTTIATNGKQANGSLSMEDRMVCDELKRTLRHSDEWFACNDIAEIVPATAGQAVLLDQCTIAHFRFSLRGVVDVDQMRDTCTTILTRHSIFRTVFIKNGHGYFQVILDKIATPFTHVIHEGDGDLENYCKSLFANESENAPFEKPPFGFILVSASSHTEHILIIRLSHAQYDGVSFPVFLKDLGAIYRGNARLLLPATQFSTYVHQRSLQWDNAAFEFWRNCLGGSKMTPLNSDYLNLNLSMNAEAVVRSKTNIPIPTAPPEITLATLVKAAWSYVLGQFRQETDVVFGQTVTGRGLPLAGMDEIQGLCLNFIPARMTIHPEDTVLDLLQRAQTQHMKSMQYDYLDLGDIIKHSTSWEATTKYGSIVQYQSGGGDLDLPLCEEKGTLECWKHSTDVNFLPLEETWVFAFNMLPTKTLHLFILTRREIMSQETADMLVTKLREMVEMFAQYPQRRVQSLDL
ncbi:hypothetical protein UA08_01138 [Talaromyces atroroseus]|uniref:Carrier domain-containing protein n=1 Tax=Talaromyces atroroseus TaxID=1441469 RepID=A0A1Q5Q9Y6_TALAT|nr:hypothetical protein UA08_01138 [Talaromyces atroroseus]OKL62742.1 hypothetical protein UA08_01138 [Talaromyces atroroseus]